MSQNKSFFLLMLSTLFWAGNYIVGQYVVSEISPLLLTFSRWIFAVCLLVPIAQIVEKPDWRLIKKDFFWLFVMSISGMATYNLVIYTALQHTTAINATLINTLNPTLIAIVSILTLGEKISFLQKIGFIISFIGAAVILTNGNLDYLLNFSFNTGDLLMLVAITLWTIYSIASKKVTMPPIAAIATAAVLSALMLAPFAVMEGLDFSRATNITYYGLLFITIFPSSIAFIFWGRGMQVVGVSRTGIFLNLTPVFAAFISIYLGRTLTVTQIVGGLLVFIGVYFTTSFKKNNPSD